MWGSSQYWAGSSALAPVRTVAPALNPVSLDEAKDHVGAAEFDDDDRKLEGYIDAAVAYLDGYSGILGRALITQTWKVNFCELAVRWASAFRSGRCRV
jgi:hypothetical protein